MSSNKLKSHSATCNQSVKQLVVLLGGKVDAGLAHGPGTRVCYVAGVCVVARCSSGHNRGNITLERCG